MESNGYNIKQLDYSIFGDEDSDIFAKLVRFDSYQDHLYPSLSENLKNNKDVVVSAASCSSNIPFIPDHFFQDTDVIKQIIYRHNEIQIPLEHLTKNIVNYMFVTCERSSLKTDDIKKACDEHLTKESIITVLLRQNNFYSRSKKEGAHPCIDDIYIPPHFLEDKEILTLLITPQFKLIKDNDNITKEMLVELMQSGYLIDRLPSKFWQDHDLIKQCLTFEHNYQFMNDHSFIHVIENNPQLNLECLSINPNVASTQRYPLFFNSFKEIFSQNIKKISLSHHVVKEDRQKLFNYMTSHEVLELFRNKDTQSPEKYDFSILYKDSHYYLNPIIDNKFIIEEMAKQDKFLFRCISNDIANDNAFMYTLLCEYKAEVNFKESPVEALYSKINHFGSFAKYVDMLKLEHSLSCKLNHNHNMSASKKMKI